ncbi:MAG: hypothetical protein IT307_13330 [Chloroflexi bacterium]|nr:hypothetical protein [Chloroflexota bacterium]
MRGLVTGCRGLHWNGWAVRTRAGTVAAVVLALTTPAAAADARPLVVQSGTCILMSGSFAEGVGSFWLNPRTGAWRFSLDRLVYSSDAARVSTRRNGTGDAHDKSGVLRNGRRVGKAFLGMSFRIGGKGSLNIRDLSNGLRATLTDPTVQLGDCPS